MGVLFPFVFGLKAICGRSGLYFEYIGKMLRLLFMPACDIECIEAKAEEHLIRLTSRMEWFPIAYHLADKVALVVFPILAYYRQVSPERHHDVPMGDGLYADLCLVSHLEHQRTGGVLGTQKEENEVTPIVPPASKSLVKKREAKPASRFFYISRLFVQKMLFVHG